MLTKQQLKERPQYSRLMERVKETGVARMNLNVQRFKAVSGNKCLGYYSTVELACNAVDGIIEGPPRTGVEWSETGVSYASKYVLDLVRGVYYTRKLRDPYPEGLKATGAGSEEAA
jgi:hypothetical protein